MRLDALGIAFERHEEGSILWPYDDHDDHRLHWDGTWYARADGSKPLGNPTIGIGHLIRRGEIFDVITLETEEEIFRRNIADVEAVVNRQCPDANQNQFNALCDLGFNAGTGAVIGSGIGEALERGDSLESIKPRFVQYCHGANHVVNPVLVGRRARGWAMFCKPVEIAWGPNDVANILASVHATAMASVNDFAGGSPLPPDDDPPATPRNDV